MQRRIVLRVLNVGNKRCHETIRSSDGVKHVIHYIDLSATNIYLKNDTRGNRDFYSASRQRVRIPTYHSGPMRLVWKVGAFRFHFYKSK